jgi:CAAX protease family protein
MSTDTLEPLQPPPAPKPWGLTMTTVWIVVSVIVMMIATVIAIFVLFPDTPMDSPDLAKEARAFGLLSCVAAIAVVAVLIVAARLRGWRARDYLGLHWPGRHEAMVGAAAALGFVLAFDAFTYLIGKDVVTPFQIDLYQSAAASSSLLLMWATLVIAAPVGEEIVFRGFLYRGWARTPASVWPAIVIISALWAIIHTQYDWFGVMQIFLIGMVLGWVRWRSGSTLLTMVLHGLMNTWATVQTIVRINWF